jgi:aminoglycoside phosphotransferase (APT) family kinase protein
MTDPLSPQKFQHLVRAIDPAWRLLGIEILSGGEAAHVVLLEVAKPDGSRERLVARRHRPRDLANNPDIARDEFRLLALLRDDGIAAPRPVHCEPAGLFETPCLVVTHVDGEPAEDHPDPGALVDAMADYLARLHRIDGDRPDLAFLPRTERWIEDALAAAPAVPDETLSETCIRQALASLPPLLSRNRPALLHGDFWPGNVIWKDGAIAGAIDWEDCAVGDPVVDIANSRLELAWLVGPQYADRFTERYVAATNGAIDLTDLPHWDLWAALRPAGWVGGWEDYDAATVERMKSRHRAFVDRAMAALNERNRIR